MKKEYCYWSVATGEYGALMKRCVRTARDCGVFKEFHVLTDRALEGCECYDAFDCDKDHGLFKLHYLKAGMSRLNFEYFAWLNADTIFVRKPVDIPGALERSPIHAPLEAGLSEVDDNVQWKGCPVGTYRALLSENGVVDEPYICSSAFWIVHREAIELTYNLAMEFWHKAKQRDLILDVSIALSYAMQMLCGDPALHRMEDRPNLWAQDYEGRFSEASIDDGSWTWRHPLRSESLKVRPAMVRVPINWTD